MSVCIETWWQDCGHACTEMLVAKNKPHLFYRLMCIPLPLYVWIFYCKSYHCLSGNNSWQIQSIFSFIYCCKAFSLASISEISTDLFNELSCALPTEKKQWLLKNVQRTIVTSRCSVNYCILLLLMQGTLFSCKVRAHKKSSLRLWSAVSLFTFSRCSSSF